MHILKQKLAHVDPPLIIGTAGAEALTQDVPSGCVSDLRGRFMLRRQVSARNKKCYFPEADGADCQLIIGNVHYGATFDQGVARRSRTRVRPVG
jgi:hypothetical protein